MIEVHKAERDNLVNWWGVSRVKPPVEEEPQTLMDPFPRLAPQETRKVGTSFKKNTGVAPDRIAMRETLVLSDQALCAWAALFQIFEMTALLPPQVGWVVVRLYDKLTEGTRPIGHLPFF